MNISITVVFCFPQENRQRGQQISASVVPANVHTGIVPGGNPVEYDTQIFGTIEEVGGHFRKRRRVGIVIFFQECRYKKIQYILHIVVI